MHQIFRDDRLLVASAFHRLLGVEMSDPKPAAELCTDVTTQPLEGRIDSVVAAVLDGTECVLAIEAQTDRDETKHQRWKHYEGYLTAKYRKPVGIVVVCSKRGTAAWARRPITVSIPGFGQTSSLRPIVFGPDNVPYVTDLIEARRDVGFAVFSAIVHGRRKLPPGTMEVLAKALSTADPETTTALVKSIEGGLVHSANLQHWSELMAARDLKLRAPVWQEAIAQGRAEGKAEGKAELILEILQDRGLTPSPDERDRIMSATDDRDLRTWARRAANVGTVAELFI
jgi:hypothetical protein